MKKKIALLLACVMAFGIAVGGTLAWLTDTTGEVKNTFTDSDINIALAESANLDLQMIPGHTITKDPKVTVEANSEACWLFVEVTESANYDDYMTYGIDAGWTAGEGVGKKDDGTDKNGVPVGVYFRKVDAATAKAGNATAPYAVLDGNKVTVLGSVTKAMMETAKTAQPTLTFKAYASQLMKNNTQEFTAAEAWANVAG